MKITPAMIKALSAAMPNIHETWLKYAASDFRRDYLMSWAGDDPDKQQAARELLNETTQK